MAFLVTGAAAGLLAVYWGILVIRSGGIGSPVRGLGAAFVAMACNYAAMLLDPGREDEAPRVRSSRKFHRTVMAAVVIIFGVAWGLFLMGR